MNHDDNLVKNHEDKFKDIYERLRPVDKHTSEIEHLQVGYTNIIAKLDTIENKLINRLPAWGNVLINILVALVTGLGVFTLTKR